MPEILSLQAEDSLTKKQPKIKAEDTWTTNTLLFKATKILICFDVVELNNLLKHTILEVSL